MPSPLLRTGPLIRLGRNRPPFLRGLEFYGDTLTPNSLWQDTAGTTPATTVGQSIRRLNGVPGSPASDIRTTTLNPFIYRVENGVPVMGADTDISACLDYVLPDAPRTISRLTVYILARNMAPGTVDTNAIASFGSGHTSPYLASTGLNYAYHLAGGFGTQQDAGYVTHHDGNWHVYAFVYDGTAPVPGVTAYCDGSNTSKGFTSGGATANVGPTPGPTTRSISIYGLGHVPNLVGIHRFAAFGVYRDVAHTPAEVRAMTDYLRARFDALFSSRSLPLVAWLGSSLLAVNTPTTVPYVMQSNSSKTYKLAVHARGGATSPPLLQRMPEDILIAARGHTGPKVLVHYPGGNDAVYDGMPPATQWGYYKQMADDARANGFTKIVGITGLPCSGQNNADRATLNSLITGSVGTTHEAVIDWAGNGTIGQDGQNLNATYYSDGIHETVAGGAIMGSTTYSAVLDGVLP